MEKDPMLTLLRQGLWGEDQPIIQALRNWALWPLVRRAYETLQVPALFQSPIHGPAHIRRVILLTALVCQGEATDEALVKLALLAASYHDVGRTFDGYDIYHGARSALRLPALTGLEGEDLACLQAAVAAHSRPDRDMESLVGSYGLRDLPRGLELARLLKDGDNLDRVRMGDLEPRFLRHPTARELVPFAYRLYQRYPGPPEAQP